MKPFLKNAIMRFVFVSCINTAFGYTLFSFLIFCGIGYPISLLISTVCGVLFNFKSIGTYVFRSRDNVLIFRFFAVYSLIYLCNLFGLSFFKYLGINVYVGNAIMLLPMGILSFFLNRYFVFDKSIAKF
ncbi:GtrA family protein [Flavihumibacter sp. R14]|nr:GtrA family protein [Flavihumibacter soli]